MTIVSKQQRFFGTLIDGIVYALPGYIVCFVAGLTGLGIIALVGYVVMVAGILLRDALMGGQSIGKKIMKYKVVKANGQSLSGDFKGSAMRNISLFIPFADAVMVLTDKPRLGDNWASTIVTNYTA